MMTEATSTPAKADELVSFDPATGEEVGRVRKYSEQEVVDAVGGAREAFEIWKRMPFDERARIVMRAREVILSEMDEIAVLISREMGKPVAEALSTDITPALDNMQFFARKTAKLLKPKRRGIGFLTLLGRSSRIIYKPLGVVGIISPWNYPFNIPVGEVTMALMAGNTVVLKPSELTPLVGEKIGKIFEAAKLPKNVLQVASGDGETGAALVAAGVDKIMFTGSVATGRAIARSAADTLTPCVLELGGKDPMIVFADADLERAAEGAVWGAFTNAGQACSSVERLYVEEKAAERFTKLVVEKAKNLKTGPGTESGTDIGAMSSDRQRRIVEEHVASFEREGAEVILGGNDSGTAAPYYPPTVVTNANNEMRAMIEETFGPVLPIATFKTESEAATLANESEYGLAASVWTKDLAKGRRVAAKIRAGSVTVNDVLYTHGVPQTPWGGFGNSGYGRTHGTEGLMELVAPQHIHVNPITFLPDVWWFRYSSESMGTFKGLASKFASGSLLKMVSFVPAFLKRLAELRRGSER